MIPVLQFTYTLSSIKEAADRFLACAHTYRIWTFSGELGAGKTTFLRSVGEQLGIKDGMASPTFALMNEHIYEKNGSQKLLMHMDWYRINGPDEAIAAGIENVLLDPRYVCCIEWPEKAGIILPKPYLIAQLQLTNVPEERNLAVYKVLE